ncbi:MAG TPA: hypothetical protein VMT50_11400, partial [Steroidobacteraceae bacterium]|nr:hypothetical protein [Steroidobacteraceae bacterium]
MRAGLLGLAAAILLVGCGQKPPSPPVPGAATGLPGRAAPEEKVVNVYNWSDYVDPKMLEQFTRETGIKVNYDTFDNND